MVISTREVLPRPLSVADLIASAQVQQTFEFIDSHLNEITEEHVRICSIPASPFRERQRAEYFREKFSALGLTNAQIDEEGNCLALRHGRSSDPLLVVSA